MKAVCFRPLMLNNIVMFGGVSVLIILNQLITVLLLSLGVYFLVNEATLANI